MVEPITIIIAVTTLFSILSSSMDWIKKRMDNQSASLPIVARTHPPAILPPEAVPSRFENDY
jgi:hypothetical protein